MYGTAQPQASTTNTFHASDGSSHEYSTGVATLGKWRKGLMATTLSDLEPNADRHTGGASRDAISHNVWQTRNPDHVRWGGYSGHGNSTLNELHDKNSLGARRALERKGSGNSSRKPLTAWGCEK